MNTLVVGALVVVAALLRLPSLGNALFGDELSSYFIVTHHGLGGIVRLLDGHSVDLTPPLYFLLSRLVVHLGDTALALRIVPWIAVLAAIPLSYVVGARTIGRRGALIGAALLALSPFLIFYGTEARAYGLVMALVLGSTACLLIALERGGAGWWLGYAVLACAAMYTHYTAVFALAAQFVWAFFAQPGARLPLVLASLAAAAGFAPWLPVLVKNSHSFGTAVFAILEPFHLSAVAHDIGHWSVGHPYLPLSTVPGRIGLALAAGGVLVAICSLAENAAVPDRLRVAGWLRSPAILPCCWPLPRPWA